MTTPARWRRFTPFAASACLLAAPASASAEITQTAQATAAHGESAPFIAPPLEKAALCIVDTGSDPLPDTSAVIARLSIDGGDGTDADPAAHHGTQMTMVAAAPINGWGTVGAAGETINVVTVRVRRTGADYTVASDVISGIRLCVENAPIYNIKVISVSIVIGSSLDNTLTLMLNDRLLRARQAGIAVVAAAGNQDGPVQYPAAHDTVLGVGAADTNGAGCPNTASGPQIALTAIGCPAETTLLDGTPAWLNGTSPATAYVAGILTQLRSLRPDLSATQASTMLTDHRGPQRELDVAAAYTAAGLGPLLEQAAKLRPSASEAAAPPAPAGLRPTVAAPNAARTTTKTRWARPRIRSVRQRSGRVTIKLAARPPASTVKVTLLIRTKGHRFANKRRVVRARSRTITTRVDGVVTGGTVRIEGPDKRQSTSVNLPL